MKRLIIAVCIAASVFGWSARPTMKNDINVNTVTINR
jgi:hypothetical protein